MHLIGSPYIGRYKDGEIYVFDGYARISCSTMDAAVGEYHRLLAQNWLMLSDQKKAENLRDYRVGYEENRFYIASCADRDWLNSLSEAVENEDISEATFLINNKPEPGTAPSL